MNEQQTIVEWFNDTYRRKGDRYLRPTKAYYVFLEILQAKAGERLLDVACGLGRLLEAAQSYDLVLDGVDISDVAIDQASKNVPSATLTTATAEALPFADATFDLVTCIGSLERMLDQSQALREMHRVGKPKARYCLMVRNSRTPSWQFQRARSVKNNPGHMGANTQAAWSRMIADNRFRIVSVLPDQYPLHRRKRWRSLFLAGVDYRSILDGPLHNANELIFLLEKSS